MNAKVRRLGPPVIILALAVGLLLGSTVLVRTSSSAPGITGPPVATGQTGGNNLASAIASLRARTQRLPKDFQAFATLGLAYVQQGAATADPANYPLAEKAFGRSLQIQPEDNPMALTGQASLAAARHDFSGALKLAEKAEKENEFSSTNFGVKGDALIELGRYQEAYDTYQRMNDLRPGVPAFTRASYALELQGEVDAARSVLEQAVSIASNPGDKAYALYYLGELSWKTGKLDDAAGHYQAALTADPSYVQALGGLARVTAAQGDTDKAIKLYNEVTRRLPLTLYLTEYADLLTSLGRTAEAKQQEDLLGVVEQLFQAQGVNVDLEQALFLADRGKADKALAAAEAEYAKRKSILVEDALGWALHVSGRDAEAIVHARSAVRLGNPDALLYFHKGIIEKSLGLAADARASLTKALSLNPKFSTRHAPEAVAALAELGGAK